MAASLHGTPWGLAVLNEYTLPWPSRLGINLLS